MTKPIFNFDYYDGTASLLHNPELITIILAENQLAKEKHQQLHTCDLNMIIDSCVQANVAFNQMTETMGQLLLERHELQRLVIETNPLVSDNEMLQLAGYFFTMIGGLRACVDRILNQAIDIRLSEAG